MSLEACMGGWCRKREQCRHYHSTFRRRPIERMCLPGQDGIGADHPIVLHRRVGEWERQAVDAQAALKEAA